MVSEFLIRKLDKHSLFPEVRGQVAVDVRDGVKGDLCKVAQGGSATPDWSVAFISTDHHQYLLGPRSRDCQCLWGRDEKQ